MLDHSLAGMLDRVVLEAQCPARDRKKKRWSPALKKELVMRLLRGEPVRRVSAEVAVPEYQLERWRKCALAGIDAALRESESDSLEVCLEDAYQRIDQLTIEMESMRKGRRTAKPASRAGTALDRLFR